MGACARDRRRHCGKAGGRDPGHRAFDLGIPELSAGRSDQMGLPIRDDRQWRRSARPLKTTEGEMDAALKRRVANSTDELAPSMLFTRRFLTPLGSKSRLQMPQPMQAA